MDEKQLHKVREGQGFIAALDQSGGSSPRALAAYGLGEESYSSPAEMFDRIHEMRTRIITSPAFDGTRLNGAILFEDTLGRQIEGRGAVDYLWNAKGVVPFLKADEGLAEPGRGVQLMTPITGLEERLARAREQGVFGTKMRSVVHEADPDGVKAVADQQFEIGIQILEAGLIPILEPEVDIKSPHKQEAEYLLLEAIFDHLDILPEGRQVMFKLSIPSQDGFYSELIAHPRTARVAALSGGYSQAEANRRLALQSGMSASFSRALLEGLHIRQSESEFDRTLDESIEAIFRASVT